MSGLETVQVATGLHPSDMALSLDGNALYVANANSDTVCVIDTQGEGRQGNHSGAARSDVPIWKRF